MQTYYKTISTSGSILDLTDVRGFLKNDTTDDNTVIEQLINTAILIGEKITGRDFYVRTYEGFFNGLYCSPQGIYYLDLIKAPVRSISSKEVYIDGSYTAITDTTQQQDMSWRSRLYFTTSAQTPDYQYPYPYKITFTSGYGSNISEDLKIALKQHVMYMWKNRGDVISVGDLNMPLESKLIYSQYRVVPTI